MIEPHTYSESPVSERDRQLIEQFLGREPRGLAGIAVRDPWGEPLVVRVASLVDGKPFPTMFWLVAPALKLALDRLEASGTIALIQTQVLESRELLAQLRADHHAYAALRENLMPAASRADPERRRSLQGLGIRGIGGIADFSRIKCLHAFYAAHLVKSNAIGRLLELGYL
ncbi:MAG: DUF501 domain-containing protein [Pseudomonadales bacterium]